jgi:hypothetical protein
LKILNTVFIVLFAGSSCSRDSSINSSEGELLHTDVTLTFDLPLENADELLPTDITLTLDLPLEDVDELLHTDMTLTFDLPLEDVDELLPTVK